MERIEMKIIIIGCPGAGKSVLTRRMNEFLAYPVMHLDKIYHTGGKSHITREELIIKVNDFVSNHDKWIIDGNYIGTLEMRVKLADTIILMKIPPKICVANAYKRAEDSSKHDVKRDDMAEGFDETITEDFINFIENFETDTMPRIIEIVEKYPGKSIKIIHTYGELEEFIENFRKDINLF